VRENQLWCILNVTSTKMVNATMIMMTMMNRGPIELSPSSVQHLGRCIAQNWAASTFINTNRLLRKARKTIKKFSFTVWVAKFIKWRRIEGKRNKAETASSKPHLLAIVGRNRNAFNTILYAVH